MENKEYEVKDIKDIVNKIPKDRIDCFLEDFKLYLLSMYELKESGNFDFDKSQLEMIWIDDCKNEIKIEFDKIKIEEGVLSEVVMESEEDKIKRFTHRIDYLKEMDDDFLDGGYNKKVIEEFKQTFIEMFDFKNALPCIFPKDKWSLSLEWEINGFDLTVLYKIYNDFGRVYLSTIDNNEVFLDFIPFNFNSKITWDELNKIVNRIEK